MQRQEMALKELSECGVMGGAGEIKKTGEERVCMV